MTVDATAQMTPRAQAEVRWLTLADGRGRLERRTPPSMWRTVAMFAVGSAVALVSLLVVGGLVSRTASEREALRDARERADLFASAVVQPALEDGLLRGDPAAIRRLDEAVRERVLTGNRVRVKLWTAQGRIVYSDEPHLIGDTFALDEEQLDALASGFTAAELSDLEAPENSFERSEGQLLEVYRPVYTPSGEALLFEVYSRYSGVLSQRASIWRTFAPITIGALILFQLCQLPLVWSLVRRLQAGQHEREHLLRQAIQASDDERRRIAGNVHDTVVQGLAGASYVVAGAVDAVERDGQPEVAHDLRHASSGIRESIRGLRSMLVEVYPPSVAMAGLPTALADLAAPLRAQGIEAAVDTPAAVDLPLAVEALVFRVAQESLRNVAQHSGARAASLRLQVAEDLVRLEVDDDGAGFDLEEALSRRDGHVGLRVLRDLVTEAGALLEIGSAPAGGTRVRLEVPLA